MIIDSEVSMEENVKEYHAVMYTDGSCLPPKGSSGGGCHGYLYTDDCFKKNGDKPNHYTITNDGYLEKHELPVVVEDVIPVIKELKPLLYFNAVYPHGLVGTNNRSELLAVIDTIRIVRAEHSVKTMLVCTDSMYVINIHRAVKADLDTRAWKEDTDRPNLDLWVLLADTLKEHSGMELTIKKVAAHGTAVGNNVADRLAYTAREMSGKGITTELYKFYEGRYWKDKPAPHPMLNFKQVYFNVGIMADCNEHMYVVMDYPKDVELGKKSPEPIYGISVFNKPVSEIDNVINEFLSNNRGNQFLTAIDLRVLYTQTHHKMSALLGNNTYSYSRGVLSVLGEDVIATPITPPGLAQNALAKTLDMYTLYRAYKNGDVSNGMLHSVDVTNQHYDVNDKGKYVFKFDTDVAGPAIVVDLEGKSVAITLVYGKDTLTKNQLKKLELSKPKISLLLKKCSDNMYEYYTVIETADVIGIYGNYYINKLYL